MKRMRSYHKQNGAGLETPEEARFGLSQTVRPEMKRFKKDEDFKFIFYPEKIAAILSFLALFLALAGIFTQYCKYCLGMQRLLGIALLFNLGQEQSLGTWYNALLLLLVAVVAAGVGGLVKRQNVPYVGHWFGLAWIFLGLSIDEVASVHERLINFTHGLIPQNGFFYYTWVVPGSLAVLAIGFFYLRFLFHLPLRTRIGFIVSALIYVGGALGMEMLEGYYINHHGPDNMTYAFLIHLEEFMEMAGLAVFIGVLMAFVRDSLHIREVTTHVSIPGPEK